ncbi:MAG: DUF4231 domain-containing protein [Planctomycetota bacterium]|nr:DUF4231 domain-containing protein [Planctomycetota bacterium]
MTENTPIQMGVEDYLTSRVDEQLKYYSAAATRAKKMHTRAHALIIGFGAAVPVVVNLPSAIGATDISLAVKLVATLMSLAVAILTGLVNFRKFGELWLTFRATEELLKQEKFLFITRAADYQDEAQAFSLFVQRVEQAISSEHSKFRSLIEESRRPTKAADQSDG